jgi:hypothetical protein
MKEQLHLQALVIDKASGPLKNIQRQLATTGKTPAKNALKVSLSRQRIVAAFTSTVTAD